MFGEHVSPPMRDRLLAALDRQEVDRPPCVSSGQTAILELQKAVDALWPQAHQDPERMARLAMAAVELGGLEGARVPFETTVDASAFGAGVAMGGPTKHPYVSWHPLADHEKLEVAQVPDPRRDGRSPVVLEAVRRLSGGRVPVLCAVTAPFTLACMLRGERETMMDLIVDPTFIHNLMSAALDFSISFVEAAVDEGADVIVVEDTWASGEILSSQQYGEFALPGERALTSKIRELGARSILQLCGHPMLNLPLMAKCGANGISVHQKVVLAEARGKLGDDIALVGNIDPKDFVLQPPEKILELSRECMGGGIDILSPACGLDPTASLRNLQAMSKAAQSYRPGEG